MAVTHGYACLLVATGVLLQGVRQLALSHTHYKTLYSLGKGRTFLLSRAQARVVVGVVYCHAGASYTRMVVSGGAPIRPDTLSLIRRRVRSQCAPACWEVAA